jgi:hypothetical protein
MPADRNEVFNQQMSTEARATIDDSQTPDLLSPIVPTADVDLARPFNIRFGWNDHTKLMFRSGFMKIP